MKKGKKIALIVVAGFVAIIVVGLTFGSRGLDEIQNLEISNPNISSLSDGVYKGTYQQGRWKHTVEVEVKNSEITDIKAKSSNPKSFNSELISSIISKQTVAVDVISGATVNTKSFQKAVENALLQQ